METDQDQHFIGDSLRRRQTVGPDAEDAVTNTPIRNAGNNALDSPQPQQLPNQGRHARLRDRTNFSRPRAAFAYVLIGTFYLLISILVHQRMNSYPVPKNDENSKPCEFREQNARRHLETLTGFGPRVSGSIANSKAENYILNYIQHILNKTEGRNQKIKMEIDVQTASGSLTLDFINVGVGEFTSVYQDLKNVVVMLSPPEQSDSSVLVNCHYDSVIDSPGAGDDAASCCVMLEILRVLSQSDFTLMHNIIFLFNSAEENILQTSHAFITQHRWAGSVKAFVNLDSAGAGGWEIVFQTGPEHPWLIRAYIDSAPYPHASVVGQEIFQTGLVPSDTDFRIFRDYGHIPGIDIAHIKNGYVYHTKNDQPIYIPAGSMQRSGENVLATLKLMATSSKLCNPGEDKHGSMVFFDVLGFFIVAYPQRLANILNWTTFVYVYVAFLKRMLRNRNSGSTNMVKPMLLTVLAMLATWIISLVVPMAVAFFLTWIGRSLSYYTNSLNIVWLFILPSVTAIMAFHTVMKKTLFKDTDVNVMVSMLQEANLILWSFVLMLMTLNELMSSYIPLLCILWPAFFYTALNMLGFKHTGLVFNLIASLAPSVYVVYLIYTLLMFLIPIMGRSGMETAPDVLIACVCGLPVLVCLPYQIGFVYTHNRVGRVITTTTAVILLGLAAVIFTPAGFPFSSNPLDASVQRAMLVHFDRRFHGPNSIVISKDASIWYQPLDYQGSTTLQQYAPWVLENAKKATCDGVYCGRPYLYPFLPHVDARKTFDFPATPLNVARVSVKLIERLKISHNEVRLTFKMSGPSHVTIFIAELPSASMLYWSFGHNIPVKANTLPTIHHSTYFIYYSHAGPPDTTWEFSLDLRVKNKHSLDSSLVRMGFAGHHLHGPTQVTPELLALEQSLPVWMLATRWSATYDEYVF